MVVSARTIPVAIVPLSIRHLLRYAPCTPVQYGACIVDSVGQSQCDTNAPSNCEQLL